MDHLLTFTTAVSIGMVVAVLFSVRRAHIRVEYSVSWLAAAVVLLLLSRWSWALESLASLLGISSGPFALLIVVFCVFLAFFFRFSVIISSLKDSNIALTQKVAILEYKVRFLNEKATPAN
jgi:hypothetical protein